MGRVLGLDYGRQRIGVAISDPLGITAQPLDTLQGLNIHEVIRELVNIVHGYKVERIVVGLPLTLGGEKGRSAKAVECFIDQLSRHISIPISTWDERLTSVEAERYLKLMNKKPSRQKEKIDQIASVLILQNFLDFHKGSPQEDPGRDY